MTTLPNLTPCTVPDCPAPILYACLSTLNGRPCPQDDPACYAPRETAPLRLPDVDTVARKIYDTDYDASWDAESDALKGRHRATARAVLDLIAAHQPVWQRVEPGTLIKEGTRYRHECENGEAVECIAVGDFFIGNSASFYVLRTAPAPTLTERIRQALNDSPESTITLDVADVEALLDMAGGEDK